MRKKKVIKYEKMAVGNITESHWVPSRKGVVCGETLEDRPENLSVIGGVDRCGGSHFLDP